MCIQYRLIAGLVAAAVLLAGCQGVNEGKLHNTGSITQAVEDMEGWSVEDQAAEPMSAPSLAEDETNELSGIMIDADKAKAVSVYYGPICYSFFSEDQEMIRQIANLFHGFSLEEVTDGELNNETTFQVYFSTDEAQIAAINVDKNGTFYLPEEHKFYKVSKGTFQLDQLDKLYQDSMNSGGFDNLRPLDS